MRQSQGLCAIMCLGPLMVSGSTLGAPVMIVVWARSRQVFLAASTQRDGSRECVVRLGV